MMYREKNNDESRGKREQPGYGSNLDASIGKRSFSRLDIGVKDTSSSDGELENPKGKKLYNTYPNQTIKSEVHGKQSELRSHEKRPAKASEPKWGRVVCKDFIRGLCTNPGCNLIHDFGLYPCLSLFGIGYCDKGRLCKFNHANFTDEAQVNEYITDNLQLLVDIYKSKRVTIFGFYFFKYLHILRSTDPYRFGKLGVMIPKVMPNKIPPHLLLHHQPSVPQKFNQNYAPRENRPQPHNYKPQTPNPGQNNHSMNHMIQLPGIGIQPDLITPTKSLLGGSGGESLLNSLKAPYFSPKIVGNSGRPRNSLMSELTPPPRFVIEDRSISFMDNPGSLRTKSEMKRSSAKTSVHFGFHDEIETSPRVSIQKEKQPYEESRLSRIFSRERYFAKPARTDIDSKRIKFAENLELLQKLTFTDNFNPDQQAN